MKISRSMVLIAGLMLIGISVAFIHLVLPEAYHESSVGQMGMIHLVFAEIVLLFALTYMIPAKGNSADLPARIALPMMLSAYALIVLTVYAFTPMLDSTLAMGVHLVLAAALVLIVVSTFIVGGHAKAIQDKEEAVQEVSES